MIHFLIDLFDTFIVAFFAICVIVSLVYNIAQGVEHARTKLPKSHRTH